MTEPTATGSPALGAVGAILRIPGSFASISWVAFSPSRVKSGSPARIGSPSRLSQPTKTPRSMFQPSRGMVIAVAMERSSLPDEVADGAGDPLRVGDDGRLQRGAVRRRGLDPVEPPDRCV